MKKLLFLITFFYISLSFAQVYEVGISYNMGNIIGEKDQAFQLSTAPTNFGVIFKKNINPRIAYRIALNSITSNNVKLQEISGGIDFNFSKYNLVRKYNSDKQTPYVIFEIASLFYKTPQGSNSVVTLPIGLGYKRTITKKIIASIEGKFRVAFTDELDGIDTNKSTFDSYYYVGASIYYTFGWPKGSKKQIKF